MGRKGYPGRLKTREGGLGKNQGLKRITMFRWITYMPALLLRSKVQKVQDQCNQLLLTAREEMFKDIRAIAELEPNEITSTWLYTLVFTLYSFISRRLPLTRISVSLYKIACLQAKLSIQIYFEVQTFCFSILLAKTSND